MSHFPFETQRALFPILSRKTQLSSCSQSALATPVSDAITRYMASWSEKGMDWGGWAGVLDQAKAVIEAMKARGAAVPIPTDVVTAICIKAPGTATRFTENNSLGEKCRPTPNISSMMPISDNCAAMSVSALNPGFAGPMTMPATKYPTNAGTLIFSATKPRHKAAIKAAAMVVMTVMLWSNSFSLCN